MGQTFITYPFAATGVTTGTTRTMPDRLNDTISVKDWGATGDGVTDDTDAIQAAINYAYEHCPTNTASPFYHGTIVFFPAGTYVIGKGGTTPLTCSAPSTTNTFGSVAISMAGAGRDITTLKGSYSTGQEPLDYPGFLLINVFNAFNVIKPVHIIKSMTIWNTSTVAHSGALFYYQTNNAEVIDDCRLIGIIGLYGSGAGSFGGEITNNLAECVVPLKNANDSPNDPPSGSIGFWFGQQFVAHNKAIGFETGFALAGDQNTGQTSNSSGNSCFVLGNTAYRCVYGYFMGKAIGGDAFGWIESGCVLISNTADRCRNPLAFNNANNCMFAGNVLSGASSFTTPSTVQSMSYNSGVVTVTANGHNISSNQKIVLSGMDASWLPSSDGIVSISNRTTNTFDYSLGTTPSGTSAGTWNYPAQYGISASGQQNSFMGHYMPVIVSAATIALGYKVDIGQSVGLGKNCAMISMSAPYGFDMSKFVPGDNSAGNWNIINCGVPPFVVFSELNSSEGVETSITDGQKSGGGSAAFGDVVAGGASGHYKARYNGTNWLRVG